MRSESYVNKALVWGVLALACLICACSSDGSGGITGSGDLVTVDPGGTGDFLSLQEAVQSVPSGSTVEIRPGTYTGRIVVSKSLRLVGTGAGTVLREQGAAQASPDDSSDDSSAVLEIRGASGVVVENLSLSGPEDGIQVRDSIDVTIRNVDASSNGDDGIDIRGSSRVTVSGVFSSNGDTGVLVREGSIDVMVEASQAMQNTENGIRVRESSDCSIANSTASGNGDDGVLVRDSSGVRVADSNADDNLGYGIRVRNSPTTVLENNRTTNNREGGVREDE